MQNPFADIERAYEPFFLDTVGYASNRNPKMKKTNIQACVFHEDNVDPFADTDVETTVKVVNVVIRKKDWVFPDRPQISDTITVLPDRKYRIMDIDDEIDNYRLRARSV